MTETGITVEICAEGLASALAAGQGGADRVELCDDLAIGGVMPFGWTVLDVCEGLAIPVHVLVRPRGGGFVYDAAEFEMMRGNISWIRACGASGVVLGLLTADGRVDRDRTARLIAAARPMSVAFHKAFDAARDPFEALDDLIALGVDRVLTSGMAPTAMAGLGLLAELHRRASGRIAVMAGGSIALDQIPAILGAGPREIHLGSAARIGGVTDPGLVRRIVEAASMGMILHITTRPKWEWALALGEYRADSLATEGFLHGSTARQVAGSADRFFRGRTDLIVLRIDPGKVRAPIRLEKSPHSDQPFPHIFGPLNLDAVADVVPLVPDESGAFAWPP